MPLALINEDAEHERARRWRARIVLLKVGQLAELAGYSWGQIYKYERGDPVSDEAWNRYKLCCAAVHAQLRGWTKGRQFDWEF